MRFKRTLFVILGFGVSCGLFLGSVASAAVEDLRTEEDRRAFADGLYSRGMYASAAVEYAELLKFYPQGQARDLLFFRMGEALRLSGRREQAAKAYLRASEVEGGAYRYRALFKRAAIFLEIQQPDAAAEMFDVLLKENLPKDIRELSLYYQGESLSQSGQGRKAVEAFEGLLKEFPQSEMADFAKLSLGRLYAEPGEGQNLVRSQGLLNEVANKPSTPRLGAEALFLMARLQFSKTQYKEAAATFQKLEAHYPSDIRVGESRLQAAWSYLNASLYDPALKTASLALEKSEALDAAHRVEFCYIRACALFQLLRYDDAVKAYRETVDVNPQSVFAVKAYYQMALAAYKAGQFDQAMESLKPVLVDEGMRANGLWLMAEAATGKGNADVAVQHYRLLVSEFPKSLYAPDALYRLGHQLQLREMWTEASTYFLKLVEQFPDSKLAPQALFASATSLSLAKQGRAALRDWEAYLKRYPQAEGVPEALYQKGLEEIRLDLQSDALTTLDTLLNRYPKSSRIADAQLWRGHLLVEKKNYKEAEVAFRAVLASNPSDDAKRQARFSLAMTLQQGERQDEAATLFQSLIDDPVREKFTPQQLAWLSEHQYTRKDYANAEKTAKILIEQTDDESWKQVAWTLVARCLRARDQFAEAEAAYRQAIAIPVKSRHYAEATLRLAELLFAREAYSEAETLYGQAVERCAAPELQTLRIHAYIGLGHAALKGGRKGSAIKYLMMVSLLYQDEELVPPVMLETIRLLTEENRLEEAAALKKDLLDTYPKSEAAATIRQEAEEVKKDE